MSINSKFVIPFKIKFKTPVTGGYATELHTKFYPNTQITNYHKDTVAGHEEIDVYTAVLQSPFTERWVGGWQHRHVPLNLGTDSATNRQEAWHLDFDTEQLKIYSNQFLDSPPSYWTRDGRTKRPVNITNIGYDGVTEGNYRENYQFLQTSGRRIANSLVADGFEPISQFKTLFITSSFNEEYELPDLLSQTGSRSVIVERFNAPGSKEETSRGALDREGEEMSPNIPLPFRNIKIRQPFYRQLAQHNPQFGSGSTYALLPDTGIVESVTIHKINRNRLPGTASINDFFDNGFVTHAIPRTDIQYSWITASAVTTAVELRGYQSYRTSTYKRRPGFDDIVFISSSLVTSGSNEQHEIDNYYLNSLSKDSKTVNIETNTFSMIPTISSSYSEVVNSNYSYPIWQSLRLSETPVVRNLRKENIFSLLDAPRTIVLQSGNVEQRSAETVTNYYEPAVTFKYKPLKHLLRVGNTNYVMETDYSNALSTFANKDLIERKKLRYETLENTNTIYDFIRDEYTSANATISYLAHSYSEIVWPKEERTGLSQTRKREAYYLDKPGFDRDGYDRQLGTQRVFWRDNQEDRKRSNSVDGGYYNSMGYLSTQEIGSSFSVEGQTILIDNNTYDFESITNLEFYVTPYYFYEDFSQETLGGGTGLTEVVPVDTKYVFGENQDMLKQGATSPYIGKKFAVLNSQVGLGRWLQIKQKLVGTTILKFITLHNLANGTYDFGGFYNPNGLSLSRPESGEDLIIQYSQDGISWNTIQVLITGSSGPFGTGVEEKNHEIIITDIQEEYYLRFALSDYDENYSDHYAISDIELQSNIGIKKINDGIYNSTSIFEIATLEDKLYDSYFSVVSPSNNVAYGDLQINVSYKQALRQKVFGEFNTSFIDFYGMSRIDGSATFRDIGSIYRNTFYKSQLTTKQYDFSSIRSLYDNIALIKTEDDEIKINPKLRYSAFLGGGELNISDYVQQNIKETPFRFWENSIELEHQEDNPFLFGYNIALSKTNNIAVIGTFGSVGVYGFAGVVFLPDGQFTKLLPPDYVEDSYSYTYGNNVAITDNGSYIAIAQPVSDANNRGFIHIFMKQENSYVYAYKLNYFSMLQNNLGSLSLKIYEKLNGDLYCFASAQSGNYVIRFHIEVSTSTITTQQIQSSDFTSGDIFGGSIAIIDENNYFISSYKEGSLDKGRVYAFESNLETQMIDGLDQPTRYFGFSLDCDSSGDLLVVGAPRTNTEEPATVDYEGRTYIYRKNGATWQEEGYLEGESQVRENFGYSVSLKTDNERTILVVGAPEYSIQNTTIVSQGAFYIYQSSSVDGWIYSQELVYKGNSSGSYFGNRVQIDNQENILVSATDYLNTTEQLGSVYYYPRTTGQNISIGNKLFEQTFTENDILFSTLDNGLQRTTEKDSGKKPFFDSYEEYLQEIYPLTKDHSQIPEFRISENLEDYISSGSFWSKKIPRLSVDGVDENDYKLVDNDTLQTNFLKNYTTSDLLKKHDKIYTDNQDISELEKISVKVSGIKKLLPYNGFYPQDRIIQIANEYDKFIDNNLAGGILNISYEDGSRQLEITNHRESDTSLTENYHIDSIKYNDQYFVAVSYPYYNNNTGLVKLFSSSAEPTIDQNWTKSNFLEIQGETINSFFGQDLKFVSSSNGIDLFVSAYGGQGQIYIKSSTDGLDWSAPIKKPTELTGSSFVGAYGYSIDVLHDDENYIICIGEPYSPNLQIAVSSDLIDWTRQNIISSAAYAEYFGIGESVSLLLEGSELYIYASAPQNQYKLGDPEQVWGQIHRFKSTGPDYDNWLSYSGYDNTKILQTTFSEGVGIGQNNIKALKYGASHYIFYDIVDGLNSGTEGKRILVSYSSDNWSNETTQELITNYVPLSAGFGNYANRDVLDAKVINDILYYSFISGDNLYIGSTENGTTFTEESSLVKIDNLDPKPRSLSISSKLFTPVFFYTDDQNLFVSSVGDRSVSLNAIVSGSEVEKAWKHAAIEPLFGPGIVYNTIKSGISVDWPAITGSVAYRQLESGVVINPFYPKANIMKSFQGENGIYNIQGSLRSIINYRVPFDNILYPKEIFAEKTQVTKDIVENYEVGQEIPLNSKVSELINDSYIYGGYECYINPSDVGDIYGQTAKRFSVPFVYRKRNIRDNGLYTLAMNNFMAETVNFFLEEGKMVTFESKPDNEWPEFQVGKTYYMDVVLQKSQDLVMMESWQSDKHPVGQNGEKMNGRYFGYPVNKTTKELWEGEELSSEERRLIHNDPAYAPYTPPYFEGVAKARISFTPETTGKYSVTEIIENMEIEDIFIEASRGWQEGSDAQIHKMSIAQSIDLNGFSKVVSSVVDIPNQGSLQVRNTRLQELPENKKWIISPRMETPVLDFSDQQFVSYDNSYLKTSGYGRGMWSGYGKIPEGSKGIFLGLSYPFRTKFSGFNEKQAPARSLLEHVGFKAETKKVGQIRSNGKVIKEAIVLIPYTENSTSLSDDVRYIENLNFIKINQSEYNRQKNRIEAGQNATDTKEETSISRMIKTMKEYVIPPEFNFIDNRNLKPFVMYFVEFEHQLTQQDLADIWQGLMPQISYNAEMETVELSHDSAQEEFFHGNPLPENLKWLVFRVKQKGIYDFGKITSSTRDDQRFAQNTVVGREGIPYSYNWPYDFCSLVEFAKVELELNYKKKEE